MSMCWMENYASPEARGARGRALAPADERGAAFRGTALGRAPGLAARSLGESRVCQHSPFLQANGTPFLEYQKHESRLGSFLSYRKLLLRPFCFLVPFSNL